MKTALYFFLLLSLSANGQKVLSGSVTDVDGKPIPGASVFLNSTSSGTVTNQQGQFEIFVPPGKFDLIISSIGYETFNQVIVASEVNGPMSIKLKIKVQELTAVVVGRFEKNGWEKWGQFFTEAFIGSSVYATQCKLKNFKAVRFRHSTKNDELSAYASEPLIIENKALGYKIHYQLEEFSYNFKTHFLFYEGYPFFETMKGGTSKQLKWDKKRKEVFYGSVLHFMRSIYQNRVPEEGFEVYPLKKLPNKEKLRVKGAYERNMKRTEAPNGAIVVTPINKDSADYYEKILRQSDYLDVVQKDLLTGDSIAYALDSITAGMNFPDYLLIIYKNKTVPLEYRRQFPDNGSAMMSQITLQNQRPIEIQRNGSYYDPAELLSLGYWAWSEKMATMLPFDYKPGD